MSAAIKSIKRSKQLLAHSVSIEIYSNIAWFPYCSMAFLFKMSFCRFSEVTCLSYKNIIFLLKGQTLRLAMHEAYRIRVSSPDNSAVRFRNRLRVRTILLKSDSIYAEHAMLSAVRIPLLFGLFHIKILTASS